MLGKVLPMTARKYTRSFLVLLASAIMMASNGSAADLRLPIDPTAAQQTATSPPKPKLKSRKQLFEEFLELKKQQPQ